MRIKINENDLCKVIASTIGIWQIEHPSNQLIWFHVANQGNRSQAMASTLYKMGLRAGVADYVLVSPTRIVFLEIKTSKGTLSLAQKAFAEECFSKQIAYIVFKTSDPTEMAELTKDLLKRNFS